MYSRGVCVTLLSFLILCTFVCLPCAAGDSQIGYILTLADLESHPEILKRSPGLVRRGLGKSTSPQRAGVNGTVRSLMRDLVPVSAVFSARSVGGRLVLESLVFLAVLATSMAVFPGWYSVLVALSALFSLYESATSLTPTPVFAARGAFLAPLNGTDAKCQVQLFCEVTRVAQARFPVVASLLDTAARKDHRGGPFVQAILGGLSGVDCATLFGCPRHLLAPLLTRRSRGP